MFVFELVLAQLLLDFLHHFAHIGFGDFLPDITVCPLFGAVLALWDGLDVDGFVFVVLVMIAAYEYEYSVPLNARVKCVLSAPIASSDIAIISSASKYIPSNYH